MGICSRREADRLLAEGRVRVNGKPAVPGQRIMDEDTIRIVQTEHVPPVPRARAIRLKPDPADRDLVPV